MLSVFLSCQVTDWWIIERVKVKFLCYLEFYQLSVPHVAVEVCVNSLPAILLYTA